jgi:hypothetical protein
VAQAAGQAEAARTTLEQALQAAHAIEDASLRSATFRDIAATLLAAGNQTQFASEVLNKAVQAVNAVSTEDQRGRLLESIACIQVRLGLADQAMATARLILVDREKRLPTIVKCVVEANDRSALSEWAISCAANLESAWTVCGLLAKAYPEQASAIAQVALHFSASSQAESLTPSTRRQVLAGST